jgi:hypothetical protein
VSVSQWAQWATVATGVASVISLVAVAWQVRSLAAQSRAQTEALSSSVYHMAHRTAFDVDQFFAENPQLRESFYGKVARSGRQHHLQQQDAAAEMIMDLFAMVGAQSAHMEKEMRRGWEVYINKMINQSSALHEFWEIGKEWYPPALDFDITSTSWQVKLPPQKKS